MSLISPRCPETPGPIQSPSLSPGGSPPGEIRTHFSWPLRPLQGSGGLSATAQKETPQGISQKTDTKITFAHSLLIWRESLCEAGCDHTLSVKVREPSRLPPPPPPVSPRSVPSPGLQALPPPLNPQLTASH